MRKYAEYGRTSGAAAFRVGFFSLVYDVLEWWRVGEGGKRMIIDVYADIVCPWCYIGERRLERALASRPDLQVERRWRPFQLQPHMPKPGLPWADFVRRKFGGLANADAAFRQVTALGAAEGITFAFDRVANAPNTMDVHRLLLFAGRYSRQWELAEALWAAYFTYGWDISSHDELMAITAEAGLPGEEVRTYLAGNEGVAEVEASQVEAYRLGIGGVPHFVIDGRYALGGAQPVTVFLRALEMAQAADAQHSYQERW